jgi:hypothetical protein
MLKFGCFHTNADQTDLAIHLFGFLFNHGIDLECDTENTCLKFVLVKNFGLVYDEEDIGEEEPQEPTIIKCEMISLGNNKPRQVRFWRESGDRYNFAAFFKLAWRSFLSNYNDTTDMHQ